MSTPWKSTLILTLLGAFTFSFPTASRAETDFGDVAFRVALMLRNRHYTRTEFDDAMSKRVFDNYMEYLDFNRMYFTEKDVEGFREKFEKSLDDVVFDVNIEPAHEMFALRLKRVQERVAKIKKELEEGTFTFKTDRKVTQARKEAPWPKDMAEADQLWHDVLEAELLAEQLRVEGIAKTELEKVAEGGDPTKEVVEKSADDKEEETIQEKIINRYTRYAESLLQEDKEDIANLFLTALATAYDPHSEYFSQSELDSFQTNMKKKLQGIGALLSMRDNRSADIQGIVVNGPADKSGELGVGDRIVAVGQGDDGEMVDITYMKLQKIVDMIRGEIGTKVRLKVIPAEADDESQTEIIPIIRDEVKLKDKLATAELIQMKSEGGEDLRVGWINLPSFYADMEGGTTSMTADVIKLLDRLTKEGIDGLVIDVRSNGGGSLEEAIKMTGLFVERGPIVQSKDFQGQMEPRYSRRAEPVYDGPLIVLQDRISASASEILAAALQDYKRALIVGGNSFGKGTVQTIYPVSKRLPFFADKSRAGAVKVTIQKFYRISGGSTQEKGVEADISLPSIYDVRKNGESSLKFPLKWDEVKKLRYKEWEDSDYPLAALTERSAKRVEADVDFTILKEDIDRYKKQIEENTISLNIEERRVENGKARQRTKDRNELRQKEYAAYESSKADGVKLYKLTLDNVDAEGLTLASDFSDEDNTGFRLGDKEDEEKNPDAAPEYPFGMDPMKRETLQIMDDFVSLKKGNKTASIDRSNAEEPVKN